jgi:biotin operon repressor
VLSELLLRAPRLTATTHHPLSIQAHHLSSHPDASGSIAFHTPLSMVRTIRRLTNSSLRHREVREAIASRIASGDLAPGDRLPSERDLQEQFSCSRSVIRQALAALARDGWILSSNQRGYTIIGPRISWMSRLRLLLDEPWDLSIDDVRQDVAPDDVAQALMIPASSLVVVRESHTSASASRALECRSVVLPDRGPER